LGKSEENTIINPTPTDTDSSDRTPEIRTSSIEIKINSHSRTSLSNRHGTQVKGIILKVFSWNFADFHFRLGVADSKAIEFVDKDGGQLSNEVKRVASGEYGGVIPWRPYFRRV
jgi:hypothetical protein